MSYTKGDWKKDNLKVRCYSSGIIADCPTPTNGGVFECTANVKLISAAPDLLDIVKRIIETDFWKKEFEGGLLDKDARAAICKATV